MEKVDSECLEAAWRLAMAVVLIAVAGCIDAIGFLKIGHLFVSFMSGNSTQLAVSLARGEWQKAPEVFGIISLFVIGVAGGRAIAIWTKQWCQPAVLLVEMLLLCIALFNQSSVANVIAPIVLAMGVQNAVVHKAGETKTSLTYVTGTLVNVGEKIADALIVGSADRRGAWVSYLLLWFGLMAGAIVGAFGYLIWQMDALLIPIAVLCFLIPATILPLLL